jgi:hypothetical protein
MNPDSAGFKVLANIIENLDLKEKYRYLGSL